MKFSYAALADVEPSEGEPRRAARSSGSAICAVLASHVALVFANHFPLAQVAWSPALGVGVDLFFVISGLLIVGRAARSMREQAAFGGAAAFGRAA